MKYMLLVHHDEESFRKRPEAERQQMMQESVQLAQQLYANGQYLGAAPLHPSFETTCVRVRDGKPTGVQGIARDITDRDRWSVRRDTRAVGWVLPRQCQGS